MEEKITREEIEQARAACSAHLEASEAMLDCLKKLMEKLLTSSLDAALCGDWLKFLEFGKFLTEKEGLLEKRREEVMRSMQAAIEAGRIPFLSPQGLTGKSHA